MPLSLPATCLGRSGVGGHEFCVLHPFLNSPQKYRHIISPQEAKKNEQIWRLRHRQFSPKSETVKRQVGKIWRAWRGRGGGGEGGGWCKAMVLVGLPLAAPIGLSPVHTLTLCGLGNEGWQGRVWGGGGLDSKRPTPLIPLHDAAMSRANQCLLFPASMWLNSWSTMGHVTGHQGGIYLQCATHFGAPRKGTIAGPSLCTQRRRVYRSQNCGGAAGTLIAHKTCPSPS